MPDHAHSSLPASSDGSSIGGGLLPFPVAAVVVGEDLASLDALFRNLPADLGAAFVVLPPSSAQGRERVLQVLTEAAAMPVMSAEPDDALGPGVIQVAPWSADKLSILVNGTWRQRGTGGHASAADAFLSSLARDQGGGACCVLLSGVWPDGQRGLRDLKEAGGVVIVQAGPAHPGEAAASDLPDLWLPLEAIADRVTRHLRAVKELENNLRGEPRQEALAESSRLLLDILRRESGHDFSSYKMNTIGRRIQKRMLLANVPSLADYIRLIEKDAAERGALVGDLFIGVTRLFRDPDAFETLRRLALPDIFKGERGGVRIWAPGCSTGEEAHSLAILAAEHMAQTRKKRDVKIFATDVDQRAIDAARRGVFSRAAVEDAPRLILDKYFSFNGHEYAIDAGLREMIVFARHDILHDPPFFRLDLVSCRNLLIYLNAAAQGKILSLFFHALNPNGYLFLGPSETVSSQPGLFTPMDKKWRIFKRRDEAPRQVRFPMQSPRFLTAEPLPSLPAEGRVRGVEPAGVMERALCARYGRPAVLVDADMNVLRINGNVNRYMEIPQGDLSSSIFKLVKKGLRLQLRSALAKALETRQAVEMRHLRLEREDDAPFSLIVDPLGGQDGVPPTALVIFEESAAEDGSSPVRVVEALTESAVVAQLDDELKASRRRLQEAVDSFDAVNEELRSSNEELMSMNEELQSSYEELETSREELQALNEELSIMNGELQAKVEELAEANSYLENLFRSSNVATLFLDRNLRILRFTPAASEVFHLIDSDLLRPVTDIASQTLDLDLAKSARFVLDTGQAFSQEVRCSDGRWRLARFMRFEAPQRDQGGVVLTLVDVTRLKEVEAELVAANRELERRVAVRTDELRQAKEQAERRAREIDAALASLTDGVMLFDQTRRLTRINQAALDMFGYSEADLALSSEERLASLSATTLDGQPLTTRELCVFEAFQGRTVRGREAIFHIPARATSLPVSVAAAPVRLPDGEQIGAIVIFKDISERLASETRLREREKLFRAIFEQAAVGMAQVDLDGTYLRVNDTFLKFTGYSSEEIARFTYRDITHPEDLDLDVAQTDRLLAGEIDSYSLEKRYLRRDGGLVWVSLTCSLVKDEAGRPAYFVVVAEDTSARKRLEEDLRRAKEEAGRNLTLFKAVYEHADQALALADRQGNLLDWNPAGLVMNGFASVEEARRHARSFLETHRLYDLDGRLLTYDEWPINCLRRGEPLKNRIIKVHRLDQEWVKVFSYSGTALPESEDALLITITDLTDLFEAKEAAERRAAEIDAALDAMTEAMLIFDADGRLVRVNRIAADFFALDEQLARRSLGDRMKGWRVERSDGEAIRVEDLPGMKALRGETTRMEELRYVRPGGVTTWASVSAAPIRDGAGRMLGSVVTLQDIEAWKEAELRLRESEERYRSFFEASLDAVLLTGPDGRVLAANRAALEMFGYAEEDMLRCRREDIVDESDPRLAAFLAERAARGRTVGELVYRRRDGGLFPGEVSSALMPGDGPAGRVVSIIRDVTERRRMEDAWRQAKEEAERREEEYRTLVENLPRVVVARLDAEGRFLFLSSFVAQTLGLDLSVFLGRRPRDLPLHDDLCRQLDQTVQDVLVQGRVETFQFSFATPQGEIVREFRVGPELVENGVVRTVIVISIDITELTAAQEEMRAAKEEAERASRAKSEFLANMSHEIRTPMNGVMGMTDLALLTDLPPQARDYLLMVKQSSNHLLAIINDILDISKIEAGKLGLEKRPFEVRQALESVLWPLSLAARDKGLVLSSSIDPEVPEWLEGDKGRLKQILTNLTGNAVKFTRQGSIAVFVRPDHWPEAEPGRFRLLVEVKDSGIGIAENRLESIFESFTQVGSSAHAEYGGTGLGLSISRQLVEMMGGKLRVESRLGLGSSFAFTAVFDLPAARETPAPRQGPPPPVGGGTMRVLLAEDNLVNRVLTLSLLRLRGYEADAVENGREVLESLARQRYDVVLMDVRMPVMDGLEATRRLRSGQVGGADPDTPVVALTAHALVGDRDRFLEAGMNDYLAKPIDQDELDRVLDKYRPA